MGGRSAPDLKEGLEEEGGEADNKDCQEDSEGLCDGFGDAWFCEDVSGSSCFGGGLRIQRESVHRHSVSHADGREFDVLGGRSGRDRHRRWEEGGEGKGSHLQGVDIAKYPKGCEFAQALGRSIVECEDFNADVGACNCDCKLFLSCGRLGQNADTKGDSGFHRFVEAFLEGYST